MKTLAILLLLTVSANAQTVNNATVNIIGSTQNVSITQLNASHSANLQLEPAVQLAYPLALG